MKYEYPNYGNVPQCMFLVPIQSYFSFYVPPAIQQLVSILALPRRVPSSLLQNHKKKSIWEKNLEFQILTEKIWISEWFSFLQINFECQIKATIPSWHVNQHNHRKKIDTKYLRSAIGILMTGFCWLQYAKLFFFNEKNYLLLSLMQSRIPHWILYFPCNWSSIQSVCASIHPNVVLIHPVNRGNHGNNQFHFHYFNLLFQQLQFFHTVHVYISSNASVHICVCPQLSL